MSFTDSFHNSPRVSSPHLYSHPSSASTQPAWQIPAITKGRARSASRQSARNALDAQEQRRLYPSNSYQQSYQPAATAPETSRSGFRQRDSSRSRPLTPNISHITQPFDGMNGAIATEAPPPPILYVRALYDYHADDRTSLSFRQGDTIQVLTQLASGWWDGVVNGMRGWFPSNYCVVVNGPDDAYNRSYDARVAPDSGTEDEEELYEDAPRHQPTQQQALNRFNDGRLLSTEEPGQQEQEEAAFWIPQVTPEGRLFYFNTLTGVSKVELPLETPTSVNESGPRNRTIVQVPEHTKPPPELMASGRYFQEDDEQDSTSEVEDSAYSTSSHRVGRQDSHATSDNNSPSTSQESFHSPHTTQGRNASKYHHHQSMGAVASGIHGPSTTAFTSSALNQLSAGGASIPRQFTDDINATPVTWNQLVENLRRAIEAYRQAINNADRAEYVRRAEDVSDHLRVLLAAASGTTDNHSGNPSIISTNRALYPHFRDMMSRFSKLVLSSHIATADFPAADAYSKCLQEAEGVLQGVYGFVEVARVQCGEDIQRLVPGFVSGSFNGGSWQNNGMNADEQTTSGSFMGEQDEYDAFNEPSIPLEPALLARMESMKRLIVVNIRRLEDQLLVREKLVTPFRHEQIGNNICQAASGILSVYRPWMSTVESIDLAPFVSTFQANQLLEFTSQKQSLYDLVAQLVLTCQYAAAPLGDEWAEKREEPLADRLTEVQTAVRALEACISQVGQHLQLLLDSMPLDDDAERGGDLRRHRTTDGGTPYDSTPYKRTGNTIRPMLGDMNFPASYSEGTGMGTEPYRIKKQDNSKVKKFFGEVPHDLEEEEPAFLRLDHEGELSYDTKTEPPQLRGGTLIALVEQLTRHDRLDSHFNNTFLLTYRSFTTAGELFDLLVKRFDIQPPPGLGGADFNTWMDKKRKPIRFRVVNILKSWFDNFWMEEAGEASSELLRNVYVFAKDHVATTATPGSAPLMASVDRRIRGQEVTAKQLVPTQVAAIPTPIMPKNMKKLKFLDIDATEFARQLTIIESRLYGRIKATECLNKQWQKKDPPSSTPAAASATAVGGASSSAQTSATGGEDKDSTEEKEKDKDKEKEPAPNVKALILHSNQLTNWVAEMILNQSDARKRVVVIKHFVAVAEKCRQLNNFSTLTSIIAALGTAPIHRLQRTWTQVNARTLNALESMRNLMASSKNFMEYRDALRRANPPCVPFFGRFLTDLTFIEDGIPSIIKRTTLINFAKRAKTAEVIRDIQTYQNVAYPLKAVNDLQDYILTNMQNAGDVHEMYDKSLEVEPREREDEKITRLLSESGFL